MAVIKKTKFDIAVINLVREKRIQKKLSQDKIAAYIGTHRSFIGQVETPETHSKYNLNHLNQIAYLIGCSPKDFIPADAIPEEVKDPAPKKKHPKKKKG